MTDTMHPPFSSDSFKHLLDCHGADLSRWPLETVKPALALITHDRDAAVLFAQAERLDDLLRRDDADMVRVLEARHGAQMPALRARILTAVNQTDVPRGPGSWAYLYSAPQAFLGTAKSLFAPGGGLLMVGLLGLMIGFMQPASAQDSLPDGLIYGQEMVITDDSAAPTGEW